MCQVLDSFVCICALGYLGHVVRALEELCVRMPLMLGTLDDMHPLRAGNSGSIMQIPDQRN